MYTVDIARPKEAFPILGVFSITIDKKKNKMLVFGSKDKTGMTGKKGEVPYSVLHTFHSNKA